MSIKITKNPGGKHKTFMCGFKNFKIESEVVNILVGHSVQDER